MSRTEWAAELQRRRLRAAHTNADLLVKHTNVVPSAKRLNLSAGLDGGLREAVFNPKWKLSTAVQAFQICFGEYRTAPTNEGLHYELPLSDSDSEAALSGGGNSGDEDDGDAEDGDTGAGGGGFGASQVAERLRQRRKGLRRAEAARKQALELLEQWAGSERLRRLDAAEDELCAAVLQLEACAGRQGAGDAHGSAAVEGAEYPEGRQGAQGSEGGPAAASGGAGAADVGHGGGGREAGEGNGIGEGLQGGPGADPNWLLELEARVVAARAEFAEAWAAVQHVLEDLGRALRELLVFGQLYKSSNLCTPMPDGDYEDRPGDSGSSRRREEEAIEELVQKLSAEAARGTPAKMLQRRAEEDVVTVFRRGGFRLLMLSLMGWVALGAFSSETTQWEPTWFLARNNTSLTNQVLEELSVSVLKLATRHVVYLAWAACRASQRDVPAAASGGGRGGSSGDGSSSSASRAWSSDSDSDNGDEGGSGGGGGGPDLVWSWDASEGQHRRFMLHARKQLTCVANKRLLYCFTTATGRRSQRRALLPLRHTAHRQRVQALEELLAKTQREAAAAAAAAGHGGAGAGGGGRGRKKKNKKGKGSGRAGEAGEGGAQQDGAEQADQQQQQQQEEEANAGAGTTAGGSASAAVSSTALVELPAELPVAQGPPSVDPAAAAAAAEPAAGLSDWLALARLSLSYDLLLRREKQLLNVEKETQLLAQSGLYFQAGLSDLAYRLRRADAAKAAKEDVRKAMVVLASHAMKHMEGVNRVAIAQGRQMEELSNELYRLQQLCGGSQEQSGAAGGAGDAATEVAFLSEYDGVAMARWGLKDQVLFMHFQWRADYWGALPVTAGMSETELFGTAFSGGGAHCNEARRDEARAWGQQQDVELSHRLHRRWPVCAMGRRSLVLLLLRMQTSFEPVTWLPYALVPPAMALGQPYGPPAADGDAGKSDPYRPKGGGPSAVLLLPLGRLQHLVGFHTDSALTAQKYGGSFDRLLRAVRKAFDDRRAASVSCTTLEEVEMAVLAFAKLREEVAGSSLAPRHVVCWSRLGKEINQGFSCANLQGAGPTECCQAAQRHGMRISIAEVCSARGGRVTLHEALRRKEGD